MAEPSSAEAGSFSGRRVLLGVTGGIAAYKAVLLARLLMKAGVANSASTATARLTA